MNGSFGRLERSIAHPSSLNGRLEVEVNVEESSCVPQSEKEGHSSDVLEGRVDCEEKRSRSDAAPRWREEEERMKKRTVIVQSTESVRVSDGEKRHLEADEKITWRRIRLYQ